MLPKRFAEREEIAAVRVEAENAEPGESLDRGHRVAGRGMARRGGGAGNPGGSRRGDPPLEVTKLELLAKIRRPLPDAFHGVTDTETRYRQRYLDLLMSEDSRRLFQTRTRIVQE